MGKIHDLITSRASPQQLRAQRVDVMRRIREKTGRHVLVLVADPTKQVPLPPGPMLHTEDIPYFEELLLSTPQGSDADIVLHSGGGLAEAAEQLSRMAKAYFGEIRFVVPTLAQSAATILALSGHRLMMGPFASLGPIDPQFVQKGKTIPAQALTEGVKKILRSTRRGRLNPGYIPILQQVTPAELQTAADASDLSTRLVTESLKEGMLAGDPDADMKAVSIARDLCDHSRWLSHGRLVSPQQLKEMGLPIESYSDSEGDEEYSTLSSLLVVTLQSNVMKLFETEAVDIARRINVVRPPARGPNLEAADNALVDLECMTCHQVIPLQLRFGKNVALEAGRIPFPKSGELKCPHCGADVDAKGVRDDVESKLGRKSVDWPDQKETSHDRPSRPRASTRGSRKKPPRRGRGH